jgi:hypothetical protein
MEDIFHLDLLPYKFIRQLSIRTPIDTLCPRIRHAYGVDLDDRVDYDDSEEDEDEDKHEDKQAAQVEKKTLNNISSDLQSAYHLLEEDAKPISIEINIELEDYLWGFTEEPQYDEEEEDDEHMLGIYEFERGFINILETIRKPVYDLMYGAASHEVKILYAERRLVKLFHLNKQEWWKEENTHKQ